jgi:hypothetical protein
MSWGQGGWPAEVSKGQQGSLDVEEGTQCAGGAEICHFRFSKKCHCKWGVVIGMATGLQGIWGL